MAVIRGIFSRGAVPKTNGVVVRVYHRGIAEAVYMRKEGTADKIKQKQRQLCTR